MQECVVLSGQCSAAALQQHFVIPRIHATHGFGEFPQLVGLNLRRRRRHDGEQGQLQEAVVDRGNLVLEVQAKMGKGSREL